MEAACARKRQPGFGGARRVIRFTTSIPEKSRHTGITPGLSHAVGDFPICRRTGGEPARSGRIPGVRSRPRAVAGAGSGPVVIRFGGLAACRRRPGAGPDAARLSGPGQGRNGLAAVQLQASPGFGEALRLAAAGEDRRERDAVQAGPVRRAVAGAGQARVLAEDAVPLAVVQVLDSSIVLLLFKSRFTFF